MAKDTQRIPGLKRLDGPLPTPSANLLHYMERKHPIHRIVQDDLSDRDLHIAIGEQRVVAELRRLYELHSETTDVHS